MRSLAPFALIPGFLDDAACRAIRAAMDRGQSEPAEVIDSEIVVDRDARRAASIEVDSLTLEAVEAKLEEARTAISASLGLRLGPREGPGFLRYGPGGFYGRHLDQAVDPRWPDASRRHVSLVAFLNSSRSASRQGDFTGGELLIFPERSPDRPAVEPVTIVPRQGSLVAFHAATAHEVRPVSGGLRDVIVDWFY